MIVRAYTASSAIEPLREALYLRANLARVLIHHQQRDESHEPTPAGRPAWLTATTPQPQSPARVLDLHRLDHEAQTPELGTSRAFHYHGLMHKEGWFALSVPIGSSQGCSLGLAALAVPTVLAGCLASGQTTMSTPSSSHPSASFTPAEYETAESEIKDRGPLFVKGLSRILETAQSAEWARALEATYTLGFEIGIHEANTESISFFDQNEYLGCVEAEMMLMKVPDGDPAWASPALGACDSLVDDKYRDIQIPGEEFEMARLDTVRQAASMGTSASSSLAHALEEGYAAGVLTYRDQDPRLDILKQGFRAGCIGTLQRRGAAELPPAMQSTMVEACEQATQDAAEQYLEILRRVQSSRTSG